MPEHHAEVPQLLAKFNEQWGPLDYLSLGDRERVHSEAIRWMFMRESPHHPFATRLLGTLLGETWRGAFVSDARTELSLLRRRLDIWVELNGDPADGIAIENKLLALESRQQTHDTLQLLRSANAPPEKASHRPYAPRRCVFLTLTGSSAGCAQWKAISYHSLLLTIDDALSDGVDESGFLKTYRGTLHRLLSAVELMKAVPEQMAPLVFVGVGEVEPRFVRVHEYAKQMNLRRTLQSVWLETLASRLEPPPGWTPWVVSESRGEALVETQCIVVWTGHKLRVGFQLQHGSPKAFVAPLDYRKGLRKSTVEAASALASRMLAEVDFPPSQRSRKLTTPRGLGFTSTHAFDPPAGREHAAWSDGIRKALDAIASWTSGEQVLVSGMSCDCEAMPASPQ